jgi:hypothetical protein
MLRALRLASLSTALLLGGCIGEWIQYFEQIGAFGTFDDEYRVQDLRVLALEVEPPELRFPPEVLTLDVDDPVFAALPPVRVRVEGYAYDPRGSEVAVELQLCAGPRSDFFSSDDPFGGANVNVCASSGSTSDLPPDVAALLLPQRRTVVADVDEPGGRLPGLVWDLELGPRVLRELALRGGDELPTLDGVEVEVVMRVSTREHGELEAEWAVMPIVARPDLFADDADPQARQDALDRANAEVCETSYEPSDDPPSPDEPPPGAAPERDCIDPAYLFVEDPDSPPVCGNGVIERDEHCEPEFAEFFPFECGDDCLFTAPVCERSCYFVLPPNTRPTVHGVDVVGFVDYEPRRSDDANADVSSGGEVSASPGDVVRLQAVLGDERELRQNTIGGADGFGPRGPAAVFEEHQSMGWYVVGPLGAIVEPTAQGAFVDQGFTGAIGYSTPVERSAGDEDSVFLVVTDDRGGSTMSRFTIRYE